MKYIPSIIAFLTVSLVIGVATASAQNYTPLVPLPGTVVQGGTTTNLSSYLSGIIKLLIALGGALAILFAIIGGTQYVAASTNPSLKEGAKERLMGALIGLAIILTSYLLLNSINPKLVQFNLALEPVTPKALTLFPPTAPGLFDDASVRSALTDLGIKVKDPTCTLVGQKNCTSVNGLGNNSFSGLGSLKRMCPDCEIVVTGGTEYWLHSSDTRHRPGNSVVDLRQNTKLNDTIKSGTSLGIQSKCSGLGPAYKLGIGTYVDEPDSQGEGRHWHVCYDF